MEKVKAAVPHKLSARMSLAILASLASAQAIIVLCSSERLSETKAASYEVSECLFQNLASDNCSGGAIFLSNEESNFSAFRSSFVSCMDFGTYPNNIGGAIYASIKFTRIDTVCGSNCYSLDGPFMYIDKVSSNRATFNQTSVDRCTNSTKVSARKTIYCQVETFSAFSLNLSNNHVKYFSPSVQIDGGLCPKFEYYNVFNCSAAENFIFSFFRCQNLSFCRSNFIQNDVRYSISGIFDFQNGNSGCTIFEGSVFIDNTGASLISCESPNMACVLIGCWIFNQYQFDLTKNNFSISISNCNYSLTSSLRIPNEGLFYSNIYCGFRSSNISKTVSSLSASSASSGNGSNTVLIVTISAASVFIIAVSASLIFIFYKRHHQSNRTLLNNNEIPEFLAWKKVKDQYQ